MIPLPLSGVRHNKYEPKKPTQPEREPEAWAFCIYDIWLFCQVIRSFRHQPVKVALIGPVLHYPELFKLFPGKIFGDGGGHLALIMELILRSPKCGAWRLSGMPFTPFDESYWIPIVSIFPSIPYQPAEHRIQR